MSSEERVLYFEGITIRLAYLESGDALKIEWPDGKQVDIRSISVPGAPEKMYELLRECEVDTGKVDYS